MKQILAFFVLSIGLPFIVALPTPAQRVDGTAWWFIVNPKADARSRSHFDALVRLLKDRGKVPPDQIHRIEGDECTGDGIRAAMDALARQMEQGDRLIFYFQGAVTKPRGSSPLYFLIDGATSADVTRAVEDRQLNLWFRALPAKPVIVLLDGFTTDVNMGVYYANRELLGDAAFVSIQREGTGNLFAQNLLALLQSDVTDLDDNRQVSIDELHRRLYADKTLQRTAGIVVPTGDIDAIVMKLSPMLQVITVPEGASVILNDKEFGQTPQRIADRLERGTYNVEVRKSGYLIPPARSVKVNLVQGESIHLSWDLESIEVFGTVKAPGGVTLEGAKVWVDGTEYEKSKQPVRADGQYHLPANVVNKAAIGVESRSDTTILEPEKTYALHAESGDVYHAEATFTLAPHESVQQDLMLIEKTWFEVAQMRFNRKELQAAITAFQNGIEETTDFPPMSPDFTKLLFDSFSEVVNKVNLKNVAYIVATAKLADRLDLQEDAKVYWTQVKSKAAEGSPEYQLATKRLRELNFGRRLINIGILVVLIAVLVSGIYLLQKQRKQRKNNAS